MKSLLPTSILAIALAMAMSAVSGINTLKGILPCIPCKHRTCPPLPHCPHGVVKDQCNCCDACLRHEDELCGNHHNIQGQCRRGLFCYARNTVIHDYQEGICKPYDKVILRTTTRRPIPTHPIVTLPITTLPCPPSSFYCETDMKCIANTSLCDGIQDCSDAADELPPVCPEVITRGATTLPPPPIL